MKIILLFAAALLVYVVLTVKPARGVMDPKTGKAVLHNCGPCFDDSAKVVLFKLGK